jgi:hypothetical protein
MWSIRKMVITGAAVIAAGSPSRGNPKSGMALAPSARPSSGGAATRRGPRRTRPGKPAPAAGAGTGENPVTVVSP